MRKLIIVLVTLQVFLIVIATTAHASFSITFLDVGQGDCEILTCDEENMLVDTGPRSEQSALRKALEAAGILKFDLIVGTHPHEDHIGNLDFVLRSFAIRQLLIPLPDDPEAEYGDAWNIAQDRGVFVQAPKVGDIYSLGEATITVLSAEDPATYENENLWSIVLMVQYAGTRILLTGDAEDINEYAMIDAGLDLDAGILKVGHHGSYTSTSKAFVDAVSPDVAIISCGEGNEYGHPHRETLNTLQECGALVYRTDLNGTIYVVVDDTGYRISTDSTEVYQY